MNYDKIVQDVIEEYKDSPIDMLGIGDAAGEYYYLNSHKDSYIRTVRDIDNLWENSTYDRNILEIGSSPKLLIIFLIKKYLFFSNSLKTTFSAPRLQASIPI